MRGYVHFTGTHYLKLTNFRDCLLNKELKTWLINVSNKSLDLHMERYAIRIHVV
jgi:hypothetical protein